MVLLYLIVGFSESNIWMSKNGEKDQNRNQDAEQAKDPRIQSIDSRKANPRIVFLSTRQTLVKNPSVVSV
jgi:hypothetical protein